MSGFIPKSCEECGIALFGYVLIFVPCNSSEGCSHDEVVVIFGEVGIPRCFLVDLSKMWCLLLSCLILSWWHLSFLFLIIN